MKSLIAFILLIPFTICAQPTNDVKKLKETIYEFGKALMSNSQEVPSSYILTFEEYKLAVKASDRKLSEKEILKNEEHARYRYSELKSEYPELTELISYDTIAYSHGKREYVDVSIVFKYKNRHSFGQSVKIDTIRTLFSFAIINNEIKALGTMRAISNFHYDLEQLDLFNNIRRQAFFKKYKDIYFSTSVYNAIPVRKKNKWGLASLKNETLLPAIYDSIFPFQSDYARVVIKGRYNLIDKNFKPVFKTSKQHIKLVDNKYLAIDQEGKYKPLFEEEKEQVVEVEGTMDDIEAYANENAKAPDQALRDKLYDQWYKSRYYEIEHKYPSKPGMPSHYVINKISKDTLSTHYGYSFIDPHGDFILGNRNDTTIIMEPSGKILFKNPYVCSMEDPGYLIIFDKKNRLYGMYCPFTNVYIKPIYSYIMPIDRDRFFVVLTQKGKFGYLDSHGEELFD